MPAVRNTTASYERCAGEPGKPYVQYATCADPGFRCARKQRYAPGDWGLYCLPSGSIQTRCHRTGARCAGEKGFPHVLYGAGCCDRRDECIPIKHGEWGKFCVRRGGGVRDEVRGKKPDKTERSASGMIEGHDMRKSTNKATNKDKGIQLYTGGNSTMEGAAHMPTTWTEYETVADASPSLLPYNADTPVDSWTPNDYTKGTYGTQPWMPTVQTRNNHRGRARVPGSFCLLPNAWGAYAVAAGPLHRNSQRRGYSPLSVRVHIARSRCGERVAQLDVLAADANALTAAVCGDHPASVRNAALGDRNAACQLVDIRDNKPHQGITLEYSLSAKKGKLRKQIARVLKRSAERTINVDYGGVFPPVHVDVADIPAHGRC